MLAPLTVAEWAGHPGTSSALIVATMKDMDNGGAQWRESLVQKVSFPAGPGPTVVGAAVSGLLVFVACFMVWYHLGGGAWRSGVSVSDAQMGAPDTLLLTVDSCQGAPTLAELQETNIDVEVRVIAFSTPFHGGTDCQELVKAHLEEPLGDRLVVDGHSGRIVGDNLQPFAGHNRSRIGE